MDADVNLYSIVFGESIFNDAIGIVMYETVLKMGQEGKPLSEELLLAACDFFVIFLGSILIGAVFALIIAYLLKRQSTQTSPSKQSEQSNNEQAVSF